MYTVDSEQLKALREVIHWRSKKEMHQTMLQKSEEELSNILEQCENENIPPHIINLMLLDKNGSGALEILRENEIEVTK